MVAGARGRARWMKDGRSTAMLGKICSNLALLGRNVLEVEHVVCWSKFLVDLVVDSFGGLDLWARNFVVRAQAMNLRGLSNGDSVPSLF